MLKCSNFTSFTRKTFSYSQLKAHFHSSFFLNDYDSTKKELSRFTQKKFSRRNILIEKTNESSKKIQSQSGNQFSFNDKNIGKEIKKENKEEELISLKNVSVDKNSSGLNEFQNNKNSSTNSNQKNKEDSTSSTTNSNLYLEILSSLSKLDSTDQVEFSQRLAQLKSQIEPNASSEINDESILNLIKSQENPMSANSKSTSEINKLIEEEVSEEEFAAESGIRFRRPPHTLEELKKTLAEADEIFERNKVSFLGQSVQDLQEIENSFLKNLPKHMKMSVLSYPGNDADIVLLGVNRYSNLHALWLSDFLGKYEPDGIGVEFPPDDPIFIDGKGSHKEEWAKFITKNIDYKFKVDPLPRNVMDVLLTPQKVETLIQNNVDKCLKMKLTPRLIFSDQNLLNIQTNISADAIFTPILHSYYTRLDTYCPVFICDYPKLLQIKNAALNIQLPQMKNIFKTYLDSVYNNNFYFDYKLMYYDVFLKDKINYLAEITRQMTYSSKRIVFVMDYKYHEHFVETWRKIDKQISPLDKFYNLSEDKNKKPTEFVDFIENLIMIDLLEDSFVYDNFVEHKNFPFPCLDENSWKAGYTNIFEIWGHYSSHYKNLIRDLNYSSDKLIEYYNEFNFGDMDTETARYYKNALLNEMKNEVSFTQNETEEKVVNRQDVGKNEL